MAVFGINLKGLCKIVAFSAMDVQVRRIPREQATRRAGIDAQLVRLPTSSRRPGNVLLPLGDVRCFTLRASAPPRANIRTTDNDPSAPCACLVAGVAPKLKLLCLHGYMQNAEVFRSRLGSMRKALKSRVEFVFIDAPFEAQGLPGDNPEEVQGTRDGRSWWQWTDTGPEGRPSKAASYTGWEVAQSALLAALRQHQPDGLLGFSQGATATALLLSHLAAAEAAGGPAAGESHLSSIKCAILVAGFLPRDPAVAALLQGQGPGPGGGRLSTVPLLFVSGVSDALVPPERTAQLSECFPPQVVSYYTHSGAHLVPTCSGEFKSALVDFLDAAAAAAGGAGPVRPLHRVASNLVGAAAAGRPTATEREEGAGDEGSGVAGGVATSSPVVAGVRA